MRQALAVQVFPHILVSPVEYRTDVERTVFLPSECPPVRSAARAFCRTDSDSCNIKTGGLLVLRIAAPPKPTVRESIVCYRLDKGLLVRAAEGHVRVVLPYERDEFWRLEARDGILSLEVDPRVSAKVVAALTVLAAAEGDKRLLATAERPDAFY